MTIQHTLRPQVTILNNKHSPGTSSDSGTCLDPPLVTFLFGEKSLLAAVVGPVRYIYEDLVSQFHRKHLFCAANDLWLYAEIRYINIGDVHKSSGDCKD